MIAPFVADLSRALSRDRLESFRPEDGTDLDMLVNYFWDIDLAESIVPCLHAAEVVLRNTIHDSLTHRFETDRWFYVPGVLEPGQLGELARALEQLARRKATPTAGRIIAELTSGFWVALLSRPYEQRLWQLAGFALLRSAFPSHPKPVRHPIHQRFNEIRKLRNRVFHFEAIWHRPNLLQEHADIHEAIGWISPTLQQAILSVDNFDANFRGRTQVETELKRHLGIR